MRWALLLLPALFTASPATANPLKSASSDIAPVGPGDAATQKTNRWLRGITVADADALIAKPRPYRDGNCLKNR
jgi:hypothetical protein